MPKKKPAAAPKPAEKKPPARKPRARRSKPKPEPLDYIVESLRPLAVPIDQIKLDPRNARTHDEDNLAAVEYSLGRYGQRKPIIVNRRNSEIEAGNATLLGAQRRGWTHIAVVWVDDDPGTQTGYALADNRTAELADWDDLLLAELVAELEEQDKAGRQDLLESLRWEEFLAEAEDDEPAEGGGGDAETVPSSYEVVVKCDGENQQRELFDQLKSEGWECRLLTL